ncbi:MAG TPA: Uma2 family endonuclease [Chloroflexota bacterium]|nr:Uma2 family endonuclease [Chloroflexota bacterium]
MAITKQRLTLEEFLALPEEKPALEYEDGEVTQKVAPKGQHSVLQWRIAELINDATRPGKVALALPELRSTYARTSRVPDISVYTWERIPTDARGRIADDFFEPPDIAIEIVSPGQSVNRLVRRCLSFVAHGVRAALLVDPRDESVLLFVPGAAPVPLGRDDVIDLTSVVAGLEIRVDDVFAALELR